MKSTFPFLPLFLLLAVVGCNQERTLTTRSPEARRLYLSGLSFYERFYYSEAKAALDSAVAIDSTFAMAWARLAVLHASTRNEPAAFAALENAERFAPYTTRREQLFISMWDRRLHFAYDNAARVADSLITLFPDDHEAYVFRGMLYANSKKYDAAIEMYRKAIEVDTAYPTAVMMLGYAYSDAGEHEKALQEMEHYVRMAPDAADPRASYADLLVRVGRYDEALEQYRKSLELKRDYWYSIRSIGGVYLTLGRLKAAEEQFHEASHFLPQNQQMHSADLSVDAYIDMQRGKYAEALQQYREAIAIDSLNGGAAFGMALALGKLKQFKETDRVMQTVRQELKRRNLTESPTMHDFYVMVARLWTEEGRLDEALAACDSALQFSTPLTRGGVYQQVAEIYLRQKSYDSVFDACEEALHINPNQPEALLTLTKAYAATGDAKMSREIGQRLMKLWKDADPDFQKLAELRRVLPMPRFPA